jgi:hypothetical protein
MALYLSDLDDRTRQFMLDELEADVARGRLYLSPYLTSDGRAAYEPTLRAALRDGTEESLATELRRPGHMDLPAGWKRGAPGRDLPATAADALAEAEFHRFYVRGLCRRAIAEGIRTLVIYRAKDDVPARVNADGMVGMQIDAASLLEDLQATTGHMPPRVLHGCPNPGMSVRLPSEAPGAGEARTEDAGSPWLSKAERRRAERGTVERRRAERRTAETNSTPEGASNGR